MKSTDLDDEQQLVTNPAGLVDDITEQMASGDVDGAKKRMEDLDMEMDDLDL